MWRRESRYPPGGGFWTPPPTWNTKERVYPAMPTSERKRKSPTENQESCHMNHKIPSGDSSYLGAKHSQEQLISKDSDRAISLFWAAINAGDRVDSALKDMAGVLKQLDRSDEGIEAIKSFRYLCPSESQDSIDNLLLELYKKSGRIQEEAELLKHKLKTLEQDTHFGGRDTSRGKQNNMTINQEKARILGNLAWVQLQLHNYGIAEQYYRNALSLEPDNNKLCNLAICLIRMDRIPEAKSLLEDVRQSLGNQWKGEPFYKPFERANEMLAERERATVVADNPEEFMRSSSSDDFYSTYSFASWMKKRQALAGTDPEPRNMHKMLAERELAIVTDNPEELMRSSSSDNFSSTYSFANWMKKRQALAETGLEPGNIYKQYSPHASLESVEQNSPGLLTQPCECKWGDEEVNQRKGQVTIGAARRLRFGKTLEAKQVKSVETAASTTNGKKLDENLSDELHFSGNSYCMTSKARKICADLIKEKEGNGKGCQSSVAESSAYAQIINIGHS